LHDVILRARLEAMPTIAPAPTLTRAQFIDLLTADNQALLNKFQTVLTDDSPTSWLQLTDEERTLLEQYKELFAAEASY